MNRMHPLDVELLLSQKTPDSYDLGIIGAEKTDDFWETVFSTMNQAKQFLLKGEDNMLRSWHTLITELEQIVVPNANIILLLQVTHDSKMKWYFDWARPGARR